MGIIISFEKGKRKIENESNSNKKKAQTATEKATTECPTMLDSPKAGSRNDTDYTEMEPEEKIEYWKSIEKEEKERFKEKYKDVLAAAGIQGLMHGWTSVNFISLTLIRPMMIISKQTRSLNSHININLKKW